MVGGILIGFGTKFGNGCTSGHGVCGLPRLSIRSLAAVCTFMAAGFIVASFRYYNRFFGRFNLIRRSNISERYTKGYRLLNINLNCLRYRIIGSNINLGKKSWR